MIILGIDPGTNATGWGLIDGSNEKPVAIKWGVIRPKGGAKDFYRKMEQISDGIRAVIKEHYPIAAGVEEQYVGKLNMMGAIKTAVVRGVAVGTCLGNGLQCRGYAPSTIKKRATGNGRADKEEVKAAVKSLLGLHQEKVAEDAADALAIAVTVWASLDGKVLGA